MANSINYDLRKVFGVAARALGLPGLRVAPPEAHEEGRRPRPTGRGLHLCRAVWRTEKVAVGFKSQPRLEIPTQRCPRSRHGVESVGFAGSGPPTERAAICRKLSTNAC